MRTLILAMVLLWCGGANAQQIDKTPAIEPPFSLEWGENPDNVLKWATERGFPVTKGKTKDGRTAIEIGGPFPNAEFDRLRFYFQKDQLVEVELQFIKQGAPEGETEYTAMTEALEVKSKIDEKLGKGQLIKNERGEKAGYKWQFIEQIWTDEEHAIWLAVFSAGNAQRGEIAVTSLHYRWESKLTERLLDKGTKTAPK